MLWHINNTKFRGGAETQKKDNKRKKLVQMGGKYYIQSWKNKKKWCWHY